MGNWLYGVAYRTALAARARIARRRARETPTGDLPQREAPADGAEGELRALLDRELSRLPAKYRVPVVLCDLEGRSRREVAGQLGIPEGTLSSRLASARQRLARRLARYGLAVSGAVGAGLPAAEGAWAAGSVTLFASTTRAAVGIAAGPAAAAGVVSAPVAALTEGVLQMMLWAKIKLAAAVAVGVAAFGLGTGEVLYRARAADGQPVERAQARPAQAGGAGAERAQEPPARERRAADEAGERERELRRALESAQRELDAVRAEQRRQRQQADEQRRRAEQAARDAQEQLQRARDAGAAPRLNTPQPGGFPPGNRALTRGGTGPDSVWQRLEDDKAKLLQVYTDRKRALEAELRSLEDQHRVGLRVLEQKQADLQRQPQGPAPGAAAGDKLDRILERLERLEKRLDRLEQGRTPAAPRK